MVKSYAQTGEYYDSAIASIAAKNVIKTGAFEGTKLEGQPPMASSQPNVRR